MTLRGCLCAVSASLVALNGLATSALLADDDPLRNRSQQVDSLKHPNRQPSAVRPADVELGPDGELRGKVLDAQGASVNQQVVTIHHSDRQIAAVTTDADGAFRIAGLRGGLHIVKTGDASAVYRFWVSRTAPPAAHSRIVIFNQEPIVRGQAFRVRELIQKPAMVGVAIGAAIALPIALHDREAARCPAS